MEMMNENSSAPLYILAVLLMLMCIIEFSPENLGERREQRLRTR
jgi:hypothetical protein